MTRTPRPKGLTELGQAYTQGSITKEELQQHVIQHYIATGFRYCNQNMSTEEFSRYTQIEQSLITQAIIAYGQTTINLIDPEQSGEIHRAVIGMLFNEALADRSRALAQLNLLVDAQGDGYKAFVSGEVNKALKLTQDSTQGIANLYRLIAGSDGTKVFIQNNQNTQVQNNYLTPDEAVQLLHKEDDRAPLLEDNKAKKALFLEHHLEDTPEVQANKQQGVDLTKEGVDFNRLARVSDGLLEDDRSTKDPTATGATATNRERHTNRRARDLNIDLEADEI